MQKLCFVLGGICFAYYLLIIGYAGIKANFSPIWLVLSFFFFWLFAKGGLFPKQLKIVFAIFVIICGLFFIAVESMLLYYGKSEPKQGADYLIILGAKVNGTVPSKTLKARVFGTIDYLKENKNTVVIVSGGQGEGESVTEASAMKKLLVEKGIEENRILLEEKSVNTEQNIRYSKAMMTKENPKLVIATSDFHIYRGMALAKKQGFQNISGCPAKPDVILTIHYYFREFFAVIKDKILKNI